MFKPSWQSGYAAPKKSAYLITSAVVWGSIPHVTFCFWLAKVLSHKVHMKSLWSPHGVPTESLISPSGTVRGLLGESPLYGDYIGSPSGLLGDSLGTGRTSAILGLICKDSLGTPQRLLEDSLGLPGTPWGLPSNVWLSVTTSLSPLVCCRKQMAILTTTTLVAYIT